MYNDIANFMGTKRRIVNLNRDLTVNYVNGGGISLIVIFRVSFPFCIVRMELRGRKN